MQVINFYAVWLGIFLGFVSGAVLGLYFHDEKWLGGYASWRRRMARLGHISFFGLAVVNLIYALSITVFEVTLSSPYPSYLLIVAAITMPAICFLSVYNKIFRHLFFIPVLSLLVGSILFALEGLSA